MRLAEGAELGSRSQEPGKGSEKSCSLSTKLMLTRLLRPVWRWGLAGGSAQLRQQRREHCTRGAGLRRTEVRRRREQQRAEWATSEAPTPRAGVLWSLGWTWLMPHCSGSCSFEVGLKTGSMAFQLYESFSKIVFSVWEEATTGSAQGQRGCSWRVPAGRGCWGLSPGPQTCKALLSPLSHVHTQLYYYFSMLLGLFWVLCLSGGP